MSAVEVLTTVREALSDPERWWQGESWKGCDDGTVNEDEATCACLLGATFLARVASGEGPDADWAADAYVARAIAGDEWDYGVASVSLFNDDPDTTHADILNVLDCAIELAREEES